MSQFMMSFLLLLAATVPSSTVSGFPFGLNGTNFPFGLNGTNWGAWDPFQKLAGCHKGDNRTGIAGLKKYFHRFGYIADVPSSNFSDNFDDVLEWALKTYQQNFNLNATGELDGTTLAQLVRPRCGNADIINGTNPMGSGKHNTSGSSIHSVGRFSFFPGQPTWPAWQRELTYAIVSTSVQPGDSQVLSTVFARAFARWSEVIPINFTETTSASSADIRIAFYDGDHGDGEAFDGVLGTLAHAFSPPDGRFHLDGAENWNVDSPLVGLTAVDLESVAVHEIGHLLGLGHSSDAEAIMYPTISSGSRKVQLAADDVDGVQQLYGSNPTFNGTTTGSSVPGTASRERDASGAEVRRGWRWGGVVLPAAAAMAAAVFGL